MKSKEQQRETNVPFIDVGQRLRELSSLRIEVAVLRDELFKECCNLQHDPATVNTADLSFLTFRLRSLEERREKLESMIAALQTVSWTE